MRVPHSAECLQATSATLHFKQIFCQTTACSPTQYANFLPASCPRWQPWMMEQLRPHLADCGGRLDTLYLDTTYCLPKHVHPPQQVGM